MQEQEQQDDERSSNAQWRIGPEFYNEDIGAEDDAMPHDDYQGSSASSSSNQHQHNEDDDDDEEDAQFEDDDMIDVGLMMAANSDEDDDDLEDEDENAPAANYDVNLPLSHRYLGDHLEEHGQMQVFFENSILSLPLFNIKHIVLLPGQVLPISTSALSFRIHMCLQAYIKRNVSIIGLMSDPRKNPIGTTARIRNYLQQEEELRIILEGRQRFHLVSPPFETVNEGTVRILPEITLGKPYQLTPSRRRFQSKPEAYNIWRHPKWLLKGHESGIIMRKILRQIKDWCNMDSVISNPNDFSYWVAANLPLSNHERMKILEFNCTEQRLLWLLEMLVKSATFACANCKNVICRKEDVFPMSGSGPQTSFVNSYGCVHDTLTVRNAIGLLQEQEWSSEFCWFPGYAWRIACCDHCSHHIGWCYKSTVPGIRPRKFYGLSRANVCLMSENPFQAIMVRLAPEAEQQQQEVRPTNG